MFLYPYTKLFFGMILIYMKSENGHYQSTLLVFETVSQATVNTLTQQTLVFCETVYSHK